MVQTWNGWLLSQETGNFSRTISQCWYSCTSTLGSMNQLWNLLQKQQSLSPWVFLLASSTCTCFYLMCLRDAFFCTSWRNLLNNIPTTLSKRHQLGVSLCSWRVSPSARQQNFGLTSSMMWQPASSSGYVCGAQSGIVRWLDQRIVHNFSCVLQAKLPWTYSPSCTLLICGNFLLAFLLISLNSIPCFCERNRHVRHSKVSMRHTGQ